MVTSVAVALREEFTFRVLIQRLLSKRFGTLLGILFASVWFAAQHLASMPWHPGLYAGLLLAGFVFGGIYALTQSFVLVVALHAAYDALVILPHPFPPPLAPAGAPLLAGVAALIVGLLVAAHDARSG